MCWRVALGARGGDAVVGCVLRRGHGGGHLGGAQVNRGRGRRYPRRRVSTDPRGSDDLLSFAVAVEIRCGGGPGERSSTAATEDARRASRAVSAVVRNRTGARVAGGSRRWRAALKQMLPRHGCAPRARSRALSATPIYTWRTQSRPLPTASARPRGLLP